MKKKSFTAHIILTKKTKKECFRLTFKKAHLNFVKYDKLKYKKKSKKGIVLLL